MSPIPLANLRKQNSSSIVVGLGALEFVGIVDVDGLPLGEEIDGGDGGFAVAIAGLLGATEGELCFRADCGSVDIDDAGEKIAHGGERGVPVAGVNESRQAVGHA